MKIRAVTGFIPLPGLRQRHKYLQLGDQLIDALEGAGYDPIVFSENLADTWLWRWLQSTHRLGASHSVSDNPEKNTLQYHCVQHQKTEWLVKAAMEDTDTAVFAWIDTGILHVPGVSTNLILDALERADVNRICIPGCWDVRPVDDLHPCWRFCGGFVTAPSRLLFEFDQASKREAKRHIRKTDNVSWEVNTWARAELLGTLKVNWYQADHNETMFTGYPQ